MQTDNTNLDQNLEAGEHEKKIASLEKELACATEHISETERQLEAKEIDITRLQQEATHEKLQVDSVDMDAQLHLTSELHNQQCAIAALETQLHSKAIQTDQLLQSNERFELEIKLLTATVAEATRKAEIADQQATQAHTTLAGTTDELHAAKEDISKLKNSPMNLAIEEKKALDLQVQPVDTDT
jgi:chromosome segregation ATPase